MSCGRTQACLSFLGSPAPLPAIVALPGALQKIALFAATAAKYLGTLLALLLGPYHMPFRSVKHAVTGFAQLSQR